MLRRFSLTRSGASFAPLPTTCASSSMTTQILSIWSHHHPSATSPPLRKEQDSGLLLLAPRTIAAGSFRHYFTSSTINLLKSGQSSTSSPSSPQQFQEAGSSSSSKQKTNQSSPPETRCIEVEHVRKVHGKLLELIKSIDAAEEAQNRSSDAAASDSTHNSTTAASSSSAVIINLVNLFGTTVRGCFPKQQQQQQQQQDPNQGTDSNNNITDSNHNITESNNNISNTNTSNPRLNEQQIRSALSKERRSFPLPQGFLECICEEGFFTFSSPQENVKSCKNNNNSHVTSEQQQQQHQLDINGLIFSAFIWSWFTDKSLSSNKKPRFEHSPKDLRILLSDSGVNLPQVESDTLTVVVQRIFTDVLEATQQEIAEKPELVDYIAKEVLEPFSWGIFADNDIRVLTSSDTAREFKGRWVHREADPKAGLIDSSRMVTLISETDLEEAADDTVAGYVLSEPQNNNNESSNRPPSTDDIIGSSMVRVLSAGSGQGKTVAALLTSRGGYAIYMTPMDLDLATPGEDAALIPTGSRKPLDVKRRNFKVAFLFARELLRLLGAAEIDGIKFDENLANGFKDDNSSTANYLRKAFEAHYSSLEVKCYNANDHTTRNNNNKKIVIIVDEMGGFPNTLKALCRVWPGVRDWLCQLFRLTAENVFLVAAGTGVEEFKGKVGSLPDSYSMFRMTADFVFHKLIERVSNGSMLLPGIKSEPQKAAMREASKQLLEMLYQADDESSGRYRAKPSDEGTIRFLSLVRNPRCAVIAYNSLLAEDIFAIAKNLENKDFNGLFRVLLPVWSLRIITEFKRLNGLSAISVQQMFSAVGDALYLVMSRADSKPAHWSDLATRYGLLTDSATYVQQRQLEKEGYVRCPKQPDGTSVLVYAYLRTAPRFRVADPAVPIYLLQVANNITASVGASVFAAADNSLFEHACADYALLCILLQRHRPEGLGAPQLSDGRGDLFFTRPFELFSQINKDRSIKKVHKVQLPHRLQKNKYDKVSYDGSLIKEKLNIQEGKSAVVAINFPQASFADVIILAPNHIFLVQSKYYMHGQIYPRDVCSEFDKMGEDNKEVLEALASWCHRGDDDADIQQKPKEIEVTCVLMTMYKSTVNKSPFFDKEHATNKQPDTVKREEVLNCKEYKFIIKRHVCYNIDGTFDNSDNEKNNNNNNNNNNNSQSNSSDAASSNLYPILHLPFLCGERYLMRNHNNNPHSPQQQQHD